MRNAKVLFIGGSSLLHGLNHRCRHMAGYLERRFEDLDLVGFDNFYSGTGPSMARSWYKARKGISNLVHSRVRISVHGSARRIVLRNVFAPPPINLLVRDLWRYVNLCGAIRPPYDVAIFGHAENAWMARLLKRSGRVDKLIYDDWDYLPGWERNRFSRRLMAGRERLCVREADAVITVNALLARLRVQQGAKQVLVVPNGVSLSLFARSRQKPPHPPTLIHMGALSPLWGIDLAIRAMPALLRSIPNIRLLIVGAGPTEADLTALEALSDALDVTESVSFLGHLEYEELPTILAEADVGIATSLASSEFRKYASPLKLIEYMAAGLPVIATRVGQTEVTMQEADAGILIDHSVEDFVAAAISLLGDETRYRRCAEAAVAYASGFDWDLLLEQAHRYVLQILADKHAVNDSR